MNLNGQITQVLQHYVSIIKLTLCKNWYFIGTQQFQTAIHLCTIVVNMDNSTLLMIKDY